MRRLKMGMVFVLAALLLSAGAGVTSGQQLSLPDSIPAHTQQGASWSTEEAPPVSLSAQEALLVDAQIYASNMGISPDEAIRRFRLQDVAGHLEA